MRVKPLQAVVLDLARVRSREEVLHERLADGGFRAKTIRDARRVQVLVANGQAQIVVVVLGRKSESGLEALLARFGHANPDVPVVVLSIRPTLEQAVDSVRGRAFDYIAYDGTKGTEDLDRCLERIIDEKGYTRSLEERLLRAVGERIRDARSERELTLRQLAQRTGLSVSLISQIELAKSSASLATLFKLSRALRIRLSDLFGGY